MSDTNMIGGVPVSQALAGLLQEAEAAKAPSAATAPGEETLSSGFVALPNMAPPKVKEAAQAMATSKKESVFEECEKDVTPFDPLDGSSDSTKSNHLAGKKTWDAFADIQNQHVQDPKLKVPKLGELTLEHLKRNKGADFRHWVECYASFLMWVKKRDSKHLRPDVQCQYLSNAFAAFGKLSIFKNEAIFQKGNSERNWYETLYHNLWLRSRVAAIKRGDPVKTNKQGIKKMLLERIVLALLDDGSAGALEDRLICILLYQALGRAVEVSNINFENMEWDEDEDLLWTSWPQVKTGRCNDLSFCQHANNWKLDFLHSFASYIVTSGGALSNHDPDEPSWLFPKYANLKDGGAATKVSRVLKKLLENKDRPVVGLQKDHTSHGFRVGAADDLAMNPLVDLVAIIMRGDWKWEGECLVFGYFTSRVHVTRAAKGLNEYENPSQRVYASSLNSLFADEESKNKLLALEHDLFLFAPAELNKDRFQGFRFAMMARLIETFEAMEEEYGLQYPLVGIICEHASRIGITLTELRAWGRQIAEEVKAKNLAAQVRANADHRTSLKLIEALQENCQDLKAQLAAVEAKREADAAAHSEQLSTVLASQQRMERMLDTMFQGLVGSGLRAQLPPRSPDRKRSADALLVDQDQQGQPKRRRVSLEAAAPAGAPLAAVVAPDVAAVAAPAASPVVAAVAAPAAPPAEKPATITPRIPSWTVQDMVKFMIHDIPMRLAQDGVSIEDTKMWYEPKKMATPSTRATWKHRVKTFQEDFKEFVFKDKELRQAWSQMLIPEGGMPAPSRGKEYKAVINDMQTAGRKCASAYFWGMKRRVETFKEYRKLWLAKYKGKVKEEDYNIVEQTKLTTFCALKSPLAFQITHAYNAIENMKKAMNKMNAVGPRKKKKQSSDATAVNQSE